MKHLIFVIFITFLLCYAPAQAAETTERSETFSTIKSERSETFSTFRSSWFHYTPYGQSLYADEHPEFFRFDIAATSPNALYDYSHSRTGWNTQTYGVFGVSFNIWDGEFEGGKYGVSVAQTASANIWMDLFESTTSPIVNTDYRIAMPTATFIHRLGEPAKSRKTGQSPKVEREKTKEESAGGALKSERPETFSTNIERSETFSTNPPFFKNYSISISPFMHESTHIGDEMVLQRSDEGYALKRVNVSYNYFHLRFTINEPEDRYSMTHTFRLGLMVLLTPREGWYFVESRDGDTNLMPSDKPAETAQNGSVKRYGPGNMPFEAYLQYQFQSPCSKHGFQGIASAEIRNRAVYAYSLDTKSPAGATTPLTGNDDRCFTYNIFIGARYNMPNYDGYFSRFALGIRAYHGNCPYGMFRSINNFSNVGVCFIYQ